MQLNGNFVLITGGAMGIGLPPNWAHQNILMPK
jgi:short-subunit dehydrogenase involved in D-alanine esterification of teichoic acids